MAERWRTYVEAATVRVRLANGGGQGVLVPGGFILTAAHCIDWHGTGRMALGEYYFEQVETRDGASFRLAPYAVEPVADIAALGELDKQELPDDADAFEEWRESIKPVPLSRGFDDWCKDGANGEKQSFRVHVLSHTGEWIEGDAKRTFSRDLPNAGFFLVARDPIRSGTSGGPIVDDAGCLVGVVSNTPGVEPEGTQPFAVNALPHWVLERIRHATQ